MNKRSSIKENKVPPIWLAVILLIFFMPVGVYLLYKRQTADKAALSSNSKVMMNYGTVIFLLGVFYIIMLLSQPTTTADGEFYAVLTCLFIFLIPGSYLCRKGDKLKKLHKCYIWYVSLTAEQYATPIDYIAEATHTRGSNVIENFYKLHEYGLFSDARLELSTREIIFPRRKNVYIQENENNPQSELIQKVVVCNSCGAKVSVTEGRVTKCDYCESLLS